MSDEKEAPSAEQVPSDGGTPEMSLDDLYGEFKPQEMHTPQSTQQQQPTETSVQSSTDDIPDPVADPDGFRRYMGNIGRETAAARSEARKLQESLAAERQSMSAQAEERDFRDIAEEIAKAAEIEPDLAEAGLLHRYVKDKGFQQIWANREQNPTAFKKVKAVLSKEMRNKFSVRVDPQIAENQRAAQDADKGASSAKRQGDSVEDQMMKASPREFDRMLARMRGSGSL